MAHAGSAHRSFLTRTSLAVVALVMAVASGSSPAGADISPEELEEAKEALLVVRGEVQDLTDRFEAAVSAKEQLDATVLGYTAQAGDLRREQDTKRAQVKDRAANLYIQAMTSRMNVIAVSSSLAEVGTGISYLEGVTEFDQSLVRDLETLEADLERSLERLAEAVAEQEVVVAELEVLGEELSARLDAVQAEYNEVFEQFQKEEAARRAAEEARRRAEEAARRVSNPSTGGSTAPVVTSGRACPVAGFVSFSDTWGAGRSGGRAHQGVDMMAARGTALVAVESGTIRRMGNGGLGGITIWLRGNSGDEFYYAHLNSWASGLSEGQSVSVGQSIGTVGTTGNAPSNVPHLHWEYHPGGGSAVNPTPLARSLCG